jgi:succinyldiaminopimelate transaminase
VTAAGPVSGRLPEFPWDRLTLFAETARNYPGGVVDLSVGTPVDPTPEVVRRALEAASDAPGYPQTHGTPALRDAAVRWFARRGAPGVDPAAVLPTVGSKELVAWLPTLLGLGPGDVVVHPAVAYPTYDVGARLAGATPVAADGLTSLGPQRVRLVWLNSPANPTGKVLPVEHLRKVVAWARERGAVVASDECYAELGWGPWEPTGTPSVLDERVCGGSHENLLAVCSMSKRSNLAGYRAALVAGDPALVRELLEVRRHAGMMVPAPVQAAMVAALDDEVHVHEQHARYQARHGVLRAAFETAGWRVDGSEAGLYLWVTRDEDCWESLEALARLGILVAPGEFYGRAGSRHLRVALTGTDERVAAAAARITAGHRPR